MVCVLNEQNKIIVNEELDEVIHYAVKLTLKEEEVKDECEVTIMLVDNVEIKRLNKEFRRINKETDVLSFPMLEYPEKKVFKEVYGNFVFDDTYFDEGRLLLGDIALSLEKAVEQSQEYEHSLKREVAYLTVHSVLHLLGYDHMEDNRKSIMRMREETILNKLDIKRE